MRSTGRLSFLLFVLIAPALGQNRLEPAPSAAVTGPSDDVSVGYTYLKMRIPGAGSVDLHGADISAHMDLTPRWGLTLDSNYVRTASILGTPHGGYLLSLLGGPAFYPVEHGNTRMFIHALAGAGLIDGAAPLSSTEYRYGWLVRFSYAVGAGVEHSVSGPFSVRLSSDYLHTAFFDYADNVRPQNNLRLTASLVFRLHERQHSVSRR